MARYDMLTAVIISVVLGFVLLFFLGISGLWSFIILGFIATYLTVDDQRSYKVGSTAGFVLGCLLFLFGFFISPELPNLPDVSGFEMVSLELSGIFTLVLGFIVSILLSVLFGSIGGKVAEKILKKKTVKPSKPRGYGRDIHQRKSKNKNPRRTLNRNYK